MSDKISKEYEFKHPMSKVWDAISNGDKISQWFIKTDFIPEEGFQYTFKHEVGDDCTTINGTVLKANPINELVYTWIVEGTEAITTVSWVLSESNGVTKLLLEHSGISNYPADTVSPMFNSFSSGWDNCASDLANFLAKVHA